MPKWAYNFGAGRAEGSSRMRNLLGGKGADLAEMSNLGLPVPPGFTITTEVCAHYLAEDGRYPEDLEDQVLAALAELEGVTQLRFGNADDPLLVSVRSGAPVSMPGMMDTVLNLGLNDVTVEGLARKSDDPRFAYDSYRRFIQMYGDVVLGVEQHHFEEQLQAHKIRKGVELDGELGAGDWEQLVARFKAMIEDELGTPFPQDSKEQLWGAIGAVTGSWMNHRAVVYRQINSILEDWGTAVNVQAMVFGNMGEDCATGVAFTRNPSTGENRFYGEFLINAQGEDVVAGIRTPQQITIAEKAAQSSDLPALEELMPEIFRELLEIRARLEAHYGDMEDIEFTVQHGQLFMLQTRRGKRTVQAALRIAVEMAREGLIDQVEAVRRIDPAALDSLLHRTLDPKAERTVIAHGLAASPGAASGRVSFSADEAEDLAGRGEPVILVRIETSPEDIHGMNAAKGILTTRGGMTSHAAVVARGMGRPCVAGAGELRVHYDERRLVAANTIVKAGDFITLDGSAGEVMLGQMPTVEPELSGEFATLMGWADSIRRVGVRANAETPAAARLARKFGAQGIGLCRTEHMFFEADRIIAMREMILADNEEGRRAALAKIAPMQREDFVELFEIMAGLPVTIRLLDPPLHEFLPYLEEDLEDIAVATGLPVDRVRERANKLHEANPMLGNRGCRLGITYPEIYEMQARAIFDAAAAVVTDRGESVVPEIMIPLVATKREFDILKDLIDRTGEEVVKRTGVELQYLVGTMIELPRAALRADSLAQTAEFFSFGTNDLTQTTFGISRDDAGSFLATYQERGILENDPFVTVDVDGVGELVRIAAERGRRVSPNLKLGICGEHGGDPASVRFFADVGLDYVSCSPYRVPIARLAVAQAALGGERSE